MLRTALEFLSGELNQYLKRKDPGNFGTGDNVLISALMKPDGTFAPSVDGTDVFKVIATVVNLEDDHIAESQMYYQKVNDRFEIVNPPVNINIYVLFSVFATNYLTALRLLSYVISFFQSASVFDSAQYPQMNANVEANKPWQRIGRLVTTLHTLTLEQQNNLWAALGAKYMPSVIYKVRTMSFVDTEPKMEAPPITQLTILDN